MAIAIEEKPHDLIDPDPNQPRKIFNPERLIELGNDIAVNGVLQAIVVRPHPSKPGRFMIIFGERRWQAAGPGYAELATMPVVVRKDVNDQQALEWQMAENSHRDDMHPLEEADGYRVMHERDGREVEEIAVLCGKSVGYIYASMKLCALTSEPRKAFLTGKLDKSRALLIARLPAPRQAEACKAILTEGDSFDNDDESDVMSFRQAKEYIREQFHLRLVDAPFSVTDVTLLSKAGSCTACPKRSGNQRELFDDVIADKRTGGEDVCTDSGCYKEKLDAHWLRLKVEAKTKGREVLEGDAAEKAGGHADKRHIDLDASASDIGEYNKSWRQVLGKHGEQAVAAVSRDPRDGEIKELISRNNLPKLLKDAGVKVKKEKASNSDSLSLEREAKEQAKLEGLVTVTVREAALAKLDDLEPAMLWKLIARLAIKAARSDAQREIMKLHEVQHEGQYSGGQRSELIAYADKLPVRAARDFAVEILLAEAGGWREDNEDDYTDEGMSAEEIAAEKAERRDYMTGVEHAAELLDLNLPAIVKKVKADIAAAAKDKADKKAPKAKPPAASEPLGDPTVKVPNITTLIAMDTEQLGALFTKVFGTPPGKRHREVIMQRLQKRALEQQAAPAAEAAS